MPLPPTRVLLIYPPSRTQSHEVCPEGILMVGTVLENAGYEVRLVDANSKANHKSTEEIIRLAEDWKPQIVGVTLVTPLIQPAYQLAGALKGNGAKLIAGGPHASVLPEEALHYGFDAVVVGEGEVTAPEAVEGLLGRRPLEDVSGVVFKGLDGTPKRTPPRPPIDNLDDLPIPARHLVNPLDYGSPDNPELYKNLFSSRGCPARCSYCSGSLFGKRFRFRSARSVLNEMFHVHRTYGTTHFHFVDDAMTMDRRRIFEICHGLIKSGFNLTWNMMTRIDSVNEEILSLAARAGCTQIDYGVESGHPETLKRIHKPHTVEMVRHIVPLTKKKGIKSFVFFILGFPWEGVEAIEDSRKFMKEISPYVECFHPAVASVLVPFPGTEVYEKYKDQYGFENWWLSSERNYDAPRPKKHTYFESQVFPMGTVLDADFFHYPPEVKQKIYEVFKFMYLHNLKERGYLTRWMRRPLLHFSEGLARVSPSLERSAFTVFNHAVSRGRRLHNQGATYLGRSLIKSALKWASTLGMALLSRLPWKR
jgi:anaerobic magnesium-protoporphyrin IX monomethyl ester cyclase